jgi:hypothetical protein
MNEPDSPLALRPREAARVLNISARHLWGLTAPRGPIPCVRLGRGRRKAVLYVLDDLKAWLSSESNAAKRGSEHDRLPAPAQPKEGRVDG